MEEASSRLYHLLPSYVHQVLYSFLNLQIQESGKRDSRSRVKTRFRGSTLIVMITHDVSELCAHHKCGYVPMKEMWSHDPSLPVHKIGSHSRRVACQACSKRQKFKHKFYKFRYSILPRDEEGSQALV